jgi:hypothetical protein
MRSREVGSGALPAPTLDSTCQVGRAAPSQHLGVRCRIQYLSQGRGIYFSSPGAATRGSGDAAGRRDGVRERGICRPAAAHCQRRGAHGRLHYF